MKVRGGSAQHGAQGKKIKRTKLTEKTKTNKGKYLYAKKNSYIQSVIESQ